MSWSSTRNFPITMTGVVCGALYGFSSIRAFSEILIDNPDLSVDELCEIVTGPDFPTGGTVFRFEDQRNSITGEKERVDAIRAAGIADDRIVLDPGLGFAKRGQGCNFIRETDFSHTGDLPLNTGGGQISAGQVGLAGGGVVCGVVGRAHPGPCGHPAGAVLHHAGVELVARADVTFAGHYPQSVFALADLAGDAHLQRLLQVALVVPDDRQVGGHRPSDDSSPMIVWDCSRTNCWT